MADNSATATADKTKDAKDEKKVETPLTPSELLETKSAVLTSLWNEDAAAVLEPKEKKDEKAADKKDDKPKEERARGEDGKFVASEKAATTDEKSGAVAEDKTNSDAVRDHATDRVPADARRVVVKRRTAKSEKGEAAEENPAPTQDVEETVRRVLDEKLPSRNEARQDARETDSVSIDPQDREVLTTLAAMEQANPRNKGIVARTRDFWKKEDAYQTQWEYAEQRRATEEGREPVAFDPDAKEHATWYSRNEPKYDPHEFEQAKENLREQRLVTKAKDELRKETQEDPDLKEWKRERARAKHEPAVQESVNHATVDLLASVPEFEKVMDDGNGSLVLSTETEKKMAEANPALFDIAQTETNRLAATLKELELIARMPEDHPVDPKHRIDIDGIAVRPHADILDTHAELERRVASAPKSKQMLGNQAFITAEAKRERLDEIINDQRLDLNAKHAAIQRVNDTTWTIQPDDVRQFLIIKSKERIKAQAEKMKKWGIGAKQDDHKNGETRNGHETAVTTVKSSPPPAGATAASSDSQDNAKNRADKSPSQAEEVVKALW